MGMSRAVTHKYQVVMGNAITDKVKVVIKIKTSI